VPRPGPVGGLATVRKPASPLERAAREYVWLYDVRHGVSVSQIAKRAGYSPNAVRAGLRRARAADATAGAGPVALDGPDMGYGLKPLFPIGSFTPRSECPHLGPCPPPPFVCMVCHRHRPRGRDLPRSARLQEPTA
jgi:hypothetical protein